MNNAAMSFRAVGHNSSADLHRSIGKSRVIELDSLAWWRDPNFTTVPVIHPSPRTTSNPSSLPSHHQMDYETMSPCVYDVCQCPQTRICPVTTCINNLYMLSFDFSRLFLGFSHVSPNTTPGGFSLYPFELTTLAVVTVYASWVALSNRWDVPMV